MGIDNRISFIAGRFAAMTSENMEYWYNSKLNKYFLEKSFEVEKGVSKDDDYFLPEYDHAGNIINASFNKRTKQGFPITEIDFIERELRFL